MTPRIEQRTGFHHLVSPTRWQGVRPCLSAEGPSQLGLGPDYETCASEAAVEEPASFSSSFSALRRHPCMSTDQPSWASRRLKLRTGVCERRGPTITSERNCYRQLLSRWRMHHTMNGAGSKAGTRRFAVEVN